MRLALLLVLALLVGAAGGQAGAAGLGVGHSIRPPARPDPVPAIARQTAASAAAMSLMVTSPRPRARPLALAPSHIAPNGAARLAASAAGPRPRARPQAMLALVAPEPAQPQPGWSLFRAALRRAPPPSQPAALPESGAVCGDPSIGGRMIAPITSTVAGCGVVAPVRVTSVAGVTLSEAATIDCPTARALSAWVTQGLQPAFGRNPVAQLEVAAHYVCRARNSRRGARISEHGRGRAVDISGFILADGRAVSVAGDWARRSGKPIKAAYRAGCGIFGTTLGPGSDGYHENHLHFDTAVYRTGSYCR